jgi:transcriptional regulator with XRE-family HTH domain
MGTRHSRLGYVDPESFAGLLRVFRNRYGLRGMSLTELAKRTGVNAGYLSRLERGEREHPSEAVIWRISYVLGLRIRQINALLEAAYFLPLQVDDVEKEYDGRFRRRGWGAPAPP